MSNEWKKYALPKNWHPAANAFALLPEESEPFLALVSDIKEHGLNNPIALYQDKVLDGRNRIRACIEAGVTPEFFDWKPKNGQTPESWSVSQNIIRRHLTTDQQKLGQEDLVRSYSMIAHLREEYKEFSGEFKEALEKVRNGLWSLSTLVRHMDWIKNGRKTDEVSFSIGEAAQSLLRFLSYECIAPLYRSRKNQVEKERQPEFKEAWDLVREEIYGISTDL